MDVRLISFQFSNIVTSKDLLQNHRGNDHLYSLVVIVIMATIYDVHAKK